jgi:hypothetical protein
MLWNVGDSRVLGQLLRWMTQSCTKNHNKEKLGDFPMHPLN